jgi:hypothetical protein
MLGAVHAAHATQRSDAAARRDGERRSASRPGSSLQRLASNVGNAAFATLARDGAGILPAGTVHPDVEAAIASTRGAGSALDAGVRDRLAPGLGDSIGDVRVHTDSYADSLSRSVAARAFTTGADVYFARGEYRPGTSDGDRLLAHELTHVVQQRGASTSGRLTVSEPGDAFEIEADSLAGELAGG